MPKSKSKSGGSKPGGGTRSKAPTAARPQQKAVSIKIWPLYVVLAALVVLYILFQGSAISLAFGISAFVLIIAILILEVSIGVKESGYKKSIMEFAIVIIAVVVFWYALRAVMGTPSPLDVVPSCSMLPSLSRGDMILVKGINASILKAPVVDVSSSQMHSMLSNMGAEDLSCVAYKISGNTAAVSQAVQPGYSVGLYDPNLNKIVSNNSQSGNLVQYTCGERNVTFTNGSTEQIAYTTGISINGTKITGDAGNPIVVYETIPQDSFYKDGDAYVVHRVYAVIDAAGSYYVLTKGDNNPGLDIQYGNYPIDSSHVAGMVIAAVKYLGYLKLILSDSLAQPAGCNYTIQR